MKTKREPVHMTLLPRHKEKLDRLCKPDNKARGVVVGEMLDKTKEPKDK